jgi:hypothetical protein
MGEAARLTIVRDEGEAEILCRMLEVEGIPSSYRVTDLSAEQGGVFGGWREILVDEFDLERARELLPHS